jgi:hypothetical protein
VYGRSAIRSGLLFLAVLVLAVGAGCATADRSVERAQVPCGVYRWRIKTLSDREAAAIRWQPIDMTIRDLVTMTPPAWFDRRRRNSNEFYVYRVRAILTRIHRNIDQDLHLLLRDPDDPRFHLVAEIPSPSCARATARYSELRANRLTARALRAQHAETLVEVVGVGFFDNFHRARGAARNGFEIHPVLKLTELPPSAERQASQGVRAAPGSLRAP